MLNLLNCPRKSFGLCEHINRKVSISFCLNACQKGRFLRNWISQIQSDGLDKCYNCKHYKRPSCKERKEGIESFCLLLTRMTNLEEYLSEHPCPIEKEKVVIHPQPKAHPARHKPIFLRADKRPMDIVGMFQGQSAFIVAGGKSFEKIDQSKLKQAGILTMALNNSAHGFRPDMWTGQDPQYRFMPSIWDDPRIMKFTLLDYRYRRHWDKDRNDYANHDIRSHPNVIFHRRHSNFIAEKWIDEDRIVWGTPRDLPQGGHGARSVLVAALHILYFLGFHKVYLIGVDFKMDRKNKYWFDEDRGPAAIRNNGRVFHHVNKHLIELQPHLLKAGFNVFNCNPDSALKAFPYYSLDKAISENLIDTSASPKGYYVKR